VKKWCVCEGQEILSKAKISVTSQTRNRTTMNEQQKLLNLAGELALAADAVVKSNAKNISWNISELERWLDAYNAEIYKRL